MGLPVGFGFDAERSEDLRDRAYILMYLATTEDSSSNRHCVGEPGRFIGLDKPGLIDG